MAREWTIESIRAEQLRTIPVLIDGQVTEAKICKYDNPADTTLQIGDDYYGTTWDDLLEALNAGMPLVIVPDPYPPPE
ncbi:MAG: hypothetical protein IT328_09550 [Caldilineaceae bacterium]|jgi:hypothetical protein|nr:hypothetical protein [Caldilineaceae bacterium]